MSTAIFFASIKFHKIMVQVCYLRLYLSIETVFSRLLQRLARMDLKKLKRLNVVLAKIARKIMAMAP